MKKYTVTLSVDNNRYGSYFKIFAKKLIEVEAENEKNAYYIAANELKKIKRYKNAQIRSHDNYGDHDQASWSINMQKIEEKEQLK